jgi:hypothetical protein
VYFVISPRSVRGRDKVGTFGKPVNALPICGQNVKKVGLNFKFGALCITPPLRLSINAIVRTYCNRRNQQKIFGLKFFRIMDIKINDFEDILRT